MQNPCSTVRYFIQLENKLKAGVNQREKCHMVCFSPLNLQTSDCKMKGQITEIQAKISARAVRVYTKIEGVQSFFHRIINGLYGL